jgi:hypothetical protein
MRRSLAIAVVSLALSGAAYAAGAPGSQRLASAKAGSALAERLVLARGELGHGWLASNPPAWGAVGGSACVTGAHVVGRARSSFAHANGSRILSSVEVLGSREAAVSALQQLVRPRAAGCLGALLSERELSGVAKPRYSEVASAPLLGDAGARYRFEFALGGDRLFVNAYVLRTGRALHMLTLVSVARPFPHAADLARYVADRSAAV